MNLEQELAERSGNACELCTSKDQLAVYPVPPKTGDSPTEAIWACGHCTNQINKSQPMNINHWRCLNESMWSEVEAVKVVAWRMLDRLKEEGWPQDLLEMMYMEEATLEWAKKGLEDKKSPSIKHLDSNGVQLQAGDSVVLIKDLNVKGTSFVAKRGAAVRNIRLVHDNAEHIEGKVNGQQIVIITKYVKKTN